MEVKEYKDQQKKGDKRKRVNLLQWIMREKKDGKGDLEMLGSQASNTLPSTNF
jgi:hypothetical protein